MCSFLQRRVKAYNPPTPRQLNRPRLHIHKRTFTRLLAYSTRHQWPHLARGRGRTLHSV
jgi:hypothetical protein